MQMQSQIQTNDSERERLNRKTLEERALLNAPIELLERNIVTADDWSRLDIEAKKNILAMAGLDVNTIVEKFSIKESSVGQNGGIDFAQNAQAPQEVVSVLPSNEVTEIQPTNSVATITSVENTLSVAQEAPLVTSQATPATPETPVSQATPDPMLEAFSQLKNEFDKTRNEIQDMETKVGPTPVFGGEVVTNDAQKPTEVALSEIIATSQNIEAQKIPLEVTIGKPVELEPKNIDTEAKERIAVETAQRANTAQTQIQPATTPIIGSDGEEITIPKFFGYQPSAELAKDAEKIANNGGMKEAKTWIATLLKKVWLSLK